MSLEVNKTQVVQQSGQITSSGGQMKTETEEPSVFLEAKKSEIKEAKIEEKKNEVIYLKNSSYKEFLERKGKNDISKYHPFIALGNRIEHLIERGKESKDFKKIESGELENKTVFINKKEYKAYIKEHPEAKDGAVLLKSAKAKEFVRDNAGKLGLDVRGEYKTVAERRAERHEALEDYRQARDEAKAAKKAAKAEYKAAMKGARNELETKLES